MNKILLMIGSIMSFYAFIPLASAQELVSFPTENAIWTVDITSQSSTGTASSHQVYVTHVEVIQFNKLKRARLTWSNGTISEKWSIPGLPVTFNQDPNTGQVRPRQNGSPMESATNAGLTYDAFAFTWLASTCLQEKDPISYQGKQCFHYKGFVGAVLSNTPSRPLFKREAWIEAKTLLPVALKTDDSLTIFTFQEKPPTEAPTLPEAFAKEIAYYKAVMGAH